LLALSTVSVAQTCNDRITRVVPNSRYAVVNNETIRDTVTNLMWARCSLGQIYNGLTQECDGSADAYHWTDALAQAKNSDLASHTDWRLPNIKELVSLIERACISPSINLTMFPNTISKYWSSTPGVGMYGWDYVQMVEFNVGYSGQQSWDDLKHVRLVRD